MRHEGKSIGYIIGEYVGERGKDMLLWFAFLTIILVVAVFALVVGIVLNAYPSAATASFVYIALAFAFGVYLYQLDGPFIPGTVVFVAGVFAGVWLGIQYPFALFELAGDASHTAGTFVLFSSTGSWVPGAGALGGNTAAWVPVILVYAALASALPVWVLLQPRDYLSSFLLYAGVGGALLAIIVGTIFNTSTEPLVVADSIEPFTGFLGVESVAPFPLFPMLFVTIACGTISGFHSLVSSGTTAKQLNKESDARLIGYGGMLGEGLLAAVALSTLAVAGVASDAAAGGIGGALPNFAAGGGTILTSLGLPASYGAPFMALVLVSFLLTSTDTAARLGRYMMEEIVGPQSSGSETGLSGGIGSFARGRYTNPVVQCGIAYLLVISGEWATLWTLFGGANQLLAALALLTGTVWLANWDDSKQLVSTGVPMALMVVVTVLGLSWVAFKEQLYDQLIQGGGAGNRRSGVGRRARPARRAADLPGAVAGAYRLRQHHERAKRKRAGGQTERRLTGGFVWAVFTPIFRKRGRNAQRQKRFANREKNPRPARRPVPTGGRRRRCRHSRWRRSPRGRARPRRGEPRSGRSSRTSGASGRGTRRRTRRRRPGLGRQRARR